MALFGWGKIKPKAVTEAFGTVEELAATIPLVAAPTGADQPLRPEPAAVDVLDVVRRSMPLPLPDLAAVMGHLPAIRPRDWWASGGDRSGPDGGEIGYLDLAEADTDEVLALAERLTQADGGRPG